ncbi:hypothetical protein ENBRE01_1934 [Enteropsectra breve]|nr:hypothetical protein ENBRE01_1934 [Enteropsectra breve]
METLIFYLIGRSLVNIILPGFLLIHLAKTEIIPLILYLLLILMMPTIILYVYYMKGYYREKYIKKVYTVSKRLYFMSLIPELLYTFIFYLCNSDSMFIIIYPMGAFALLTVPLVCTYRLLERSSENDLKGADFVVEIIADDYNGDPGLIPGQQVVLLRAIVGGYVVEDEYGQEFIIGENDISHDKTYCTYVEKDI